MIRLENVSKYYVGNNEVALGLRKINLEFTVGELVAITGESGSGKSTLLNVLSGSDTYEEGEIYINDRPTSYFDEKDWEKFRREYIGFIYQSYNLIDSYTVFENVNIALVVKGSVQDNREKVMEYLDKVGIKDMADKKATQLSSGQKQRLAIARALAKETEILVADEPTGNLDSDNSAEVMEILNKLAEDKLVFVVTHNYDEIEPYATRKIRMYDGEVAEDITLRPKKLSADKIREAEERDHEKEKLDARKPKKDIKEEQKEKNKITDKIVRLNRKSRPMTFAFLLGFMTVAAAAFFILLGSFFTNLDNTTSKIFDNKKFVNSDITRIVVRNTDDSTFSRADLEKLGDVKYVVQTDMYDSVSDTYYLLEQNVDYQYYYNYRENKKLEPDYIRPYALKKDKFMKTAACITEDDLKAGSIPEKLYDIAVYSEDESIIGTTKSFYLGNDNLWGTDLVYVTCTVTGILDDNTQQIYFSEKMGQMLTADPNKYINYMSEKNQASEFYNGTDVSILGVSVYGQMTNGSVDNPEIEMVDYDTDEELEEYASKALTDKSPRPIFVVNEKLTGNEVIISSEFLARTYTSDTTGNITPHSLYNVLRYAPYNQEYINELQTLEKTLLNLIDNPEKNAVRIEELEAEIEEVTEKAYGPEIIMVAQQETSMSTGNVIEISEELFEQIAGYMDSEQVAVYIKDYAYAENVLEDIKDMDYDVASVYQVAAINYDMTLVQKKAVSMGISLAAFIMVFLIGVFIIGLIMNLRMRDFRILRLLGLERESLNQINNKDIVINMAMAVVVSLVIIALLNIFSVPYIANIVKYYRIRHYLIYAAAVAGFIYLLCIRSSARVKKMMK